MPSIDTVTRAWVNHCVRGTNKKDTGSTGVQRSRDGGFVTRVSWAGRVIRSHNTPVAKVYGEPGEPGQFALVSVNSYSPSTGNQLRSIRSRLGGHLPVFEVPLIGEPGGWNSGDILVRSVDDPRFELVHADNLRWFRERWQGQIESARASWRSTTWDNSQYYGWRNQLERAWTPYADYVGHFNLKHTLPRLGEMIAAIEDHRAEKLRVYNLPRNVERRARAAARRLLKKVMLPEA